MNILEDIIKKIDVGIWSLFACIFAGGILFMKKETFVYIYMYVNQFEFLSKVLHYQMAVILYKIIMFIPTFYFLSSIVCFAYIIKKLNNLEKMNQKNKKENNPENKKEDNPENNEVDNPENNEEDNKMKDFLTVSELFEELDDFLILNSKGKIKSSNMTKKLETDGGKVLNVNNEIEESIMALKELEKSISIFYSFDKTLPEVRKLAILSLLLFTILYKCSINFSCINDMDLAYLILGLVICLSLIVFFPTLLAFISNEIKDQINIWYNKIEASQKQ